MPTLRMHVHALVQAQAPVCFLSDIHYAVMKSNPILLASSWATIFSGLLYACSATSYSTNPFSDAFVTTGPGASLSDDNFGAAGALAVAAGGLAEGEFQSVLQFDLSGEHSSFDAQFGAGSWTVQSVTLQLTASP